jgi:hypothetical protein
MERWITIDEVNHRAKTHPDITDDDKENFYFDLQMLYLTDKGKEKINKPIVKNQQRNKMKLCPIHNETLNEDGLCNTCLEQSNK